MRQGAFSVCVIGALAASVLLGACQSTQDKAAKLREEGDANAATLVALTIPEPDKSIKVLGTTLLHDQYGDAVAVELKNTGKNTVLEAPILVDLKGPDGQTVFKNDAPGLDDSLNHVPVIEPGETVVWVNDQLQAAQQPKSAKVTVGPPAAPAPKAPLPKLEATSPKVQDDPSGVKAVGEVKNLSKTDQLVQSVYVVARSGNKIVAAGRGVIKNLKVGRPGKYAIFFIGDPKGAEVSVAVPPSTVQ